MRPLNALRAARCRPRGQSIPELALILPVLLLLLVGAVDLGRAFYGQITVTNAAKEGALVASQGGTFVAGAPCSGTNSVMCGVLAEAKGGFVEVSQANVTQSPAGPVACPVDSPLGTPVQVTVSAPFKLIMPVLGSALNMTLTGTVKAECAVLPQAALLPQPTPTPCPNTVPTVNGLAAPLAADAAIVGAGLTPNGSVVSTGPKNGLAKNQNPAAGTCVAAGATVSYEYRP